MLLFLAALLPLATWQLSTAASLETRLGLGDEGDPRMDLETLKQQLATLKNGLSNFHKRSCAMGLNSHHCAMAQLDDILKSSDYLSSGFSPGKRNSDNSPLSDPGLLPQWYDNGQNEIKRDQKRQSSCFFRLGNHCLTEAMDSAASQYYFLTSGRSPGRKRRQAQSPSVLQEKRQQVLSARRR